MKSKTIVAFFFNRLLDLFWQIFWSSRKHSAQVEPEYIKIWDITRKPLMESQGTPPLIKQNLITVTKWSTETCWMIPKCQASTRIKRCQHILGNHIISLHCDTFACLNKTKAINSFSWLIMSVYIPSLTAESVISFIPFVRYSGSTANPQLSGKWVQFLTNLLSFNHKLMSSGLFLPVFTVLQAKRCQ